MIEVTKRSTNGSYKSKGVLLTINHSLNREHVSDILRCFHDEFGNEALRDVLVETGLLSKIERPTKFVDSPGQFYLSADFDSAHVKKFGSVDLALLEAKNMASLYQKGATVLKAVANVEAISHPVTFNISKL